MKPSFMFVCRYLVLVSFLKSLCWRENQTPSVAPHAYKPFTPPWKLSERRSRPTAPEFPLTSWSAGEERISIPQSSRLSSARRLRLRGCSLMIFSCASTESIRTWAPHQTVSVLCSVYYLCSCACAWLLCSAAFRFDPVLGSSLEMALFWRSLVCLATLTSCLGIFIGGEQDVGSPLRVAQCRATCLERVSRLPCLQFGLLLASIREWGRGYPKWHVKLRRDKSRNGRLGSLKHPVLSARFQKRLQKEFQTTTFKPSFNRINMMKRVYETVKILSLKDISRII